MGIEIVKEPQWDSVDFFAWKTFLETRAGLRLLPRVCEATPALLGKGDSNEILIRSGEMRGFQLAIQTLLSLASPPPEPAQKEIERWPSLHDDQSWADGQTLTQK